MEGGFRITDRGSEAAEFVSRSEPLNARCKIGSFGVVDMTNLHDEELLVQPPSGRLCV